MNRIFVISFLLIVSLFFLVSSKPFKLQNKDDYWLRKCKCDTCIHGYDYCGYTDRQGNYKILPGKYSICYTDTFREIAIVLDSRDGFIAINRNDKELFKIFPFDNGPDYISENLFRIVDSNNTMGFADMKGNIVIPPRFKFVFPFSDGLAAFNNTCIFVKDGTGEHTSCAGGKWGYINKNGKVVIEPKFDKALPFSNNSAEVEMNGKDYIIDKKGNIIK